MSETILSSVNLNQTHIVEVLNSMKDTLMSEVSSLLALKSANTVDVESIISEIDRKFNYSLSLMSSKLADQMRVSKAHESELSQVKSVLKEMNDRYLMLLNRMTNKENNTELREALDDEHVSFKTLEEYVKKTFQLYDADKTGMTDFASESLGGSVLFTRCTETYDDNSRWFTVLNLPITRITVSPRVVIQVSLCVFVILIQSTKYY